MGGGERIVSLLPSATEIVGCLGLSAQLVGVSHECDLLAPGEEECESLVASGKLLRVTSSTISPHDTSQTAINDVRAAWRPPGPARYAKVTHKPPSAAAGGLAPRLSSFTTNAPIGASDDSSVVVPRCAVCCVAPQAVYDSLRQGQSLYSILPEPFAKAKPTLVITQALCEVCAPSGAHVTAACRRLPATGGDEKSPVRVLNLEPHILSDVASTFPAVAEAATGSPELGQRLAERFLADIARVSAACGAAGAVLEGRRRLRCFLMEWCDPIFDGGHWVRGRRCTQRIAHTLRSVSCVVSAIESDMCVQVPEMMLAAGCAPGTRAAGAKSTILDPKAREDKESNPVPCLRPVLVCIVTCPTQRNAWTSYPPTHPPCPERISAGAHGLRPGPPPGRLLRLRPGAERPRRPGAVGETVVPFASVRAGWAGVRGGWEPVFRTAEPVAGRGPCGARAVRGGGGGGVGRARERRGRGGRGAAAAGCGCWGSGGD